MDNLVINTIMERKTIRAFKKDMPVSKEQLDALIDAALTSPTAVNAQGWHFSVIQNPDLIDEIEKEVVSVIMASDNETAKERTKSRNNKVIYNAPLLIVISSKPSAYAHIDAGIAVQSLAIAAKGMGLESAILGMVGMAYKGQKSDYFREKTYVPEGYEFVISIAIGYGDMKGADKELDRSKFTVI